MKTSSLSREELIQKCESLELDLQRTGNDGWVKAIQSLNDTVMIIDRDFIIRDINNQGLDLLKKSRDEVVGESCFRIFHGSNLEIPGCPLKKSLESKKTEIMERYEPELQRYFSIKISPVLDDDGNVVEFVDVIRDITELKRKEEQLHEREELYRTTFAHADVGLTHVDEHGIILKVNRKLCSMLGYREEELTGAHVRNFTLEEDFEQEVSYIRELKKNRTKTFTLEKRYLRKDGTAIWANLYSTVIRKEDGSIRFFVSVISDISELKEAQERISQSERQLQTLLGNLPGMAYRCRNESRWPMDFISQGVKDITGYKPGELMDGGDREFGDLIHPGDRDYVWNSIQEAVRKKSPFQLEYRVAARDGSMRWVWERGRAVKTDESGTVYLEGFISDITQRYNAEEALRENEEKYRLLIDYQTDMVVKVDPNGVFDYVSPSYCETFGKSEEELLGKSLMPLVHEEDREITRQAMEDLYNPPYKTYIEQRAMTGKGWRWLGWMDTAVLDEKGKISYIIGVGRDITEKKEAERALIESEARFRNIYENMTVGIARVNLDFEIEAANEAYCAMLGYTEEELKGLHLGDITIPETQEENLVKQERLASGQIDHYRMEKQFLHKDGFTIYGILDANLIRSGDEKPLYFLGSVLDISQRKQMEVDLLAAKEKAEQSDRLKSAFLANMSHEIRTPMNGILGFANLLRQEDLSFTKRKEYLRIIERSGNRMLNTINDLIDISKIEAGELEVTETEVNINELTEYLYTFFKPELDLKKIAFSLDLALPGHQAVISTDYEKLSAILTNLIKNAIKYTREGEVLIGYTQRGKSLEFFVKDTGIGISKNHLQTIFDRFVRADLSLASEYEGSGLGLSISSAYAEMLGGRIRVESELDKGSTFYAEIPYRPLKQKKERPQQKEETGRKAGKMDLVVLIAEDEETSDLFLTEILSDTASSLYHARSGEEAVAACRKHPEINLVLMDLKMPGMDGLEAARKIRAFNEELKIIAQTAHAMTGDREKALEAGCNEYISKPIDEKDLREMIDRVIEDPSS